jgi:hypothetical protein
MRPWLRWVLFVSLVASAVALWWPETITRAIERTEAAVSGASNLAPAARPGQDMESAAVLPSLPARLSPISLEVAAFDPFVGLQPPPPPAPPVPVPVAVAPQPPPVPTAPPLAYRYLGQMVDPSGKRFVYLGKADKEMPVTVGTQLEEGYVVQSIGPEGIRLHYPPLDAHAVIPMPLDNDSNQR